MATTSEAVQHQTEHPAALGEIIITPLPEDEAKAFMEKIESERLYADDIPLDI